MRWATFPAKRFSDMVTPGEGARNPRQAYGPTRYRHPTKGTRRSGPRAIRSFSPRVAAWAFGLRWPGVAERTGIPQLRRYVQLPVATHESQPAPVTPIAANSLGHKAGVHELPFCFARAARSEKSEKVGKRGALRIIRGMLANGKSRAADTADTPDAPLLHCRRNAADDIFRPDVKSRLIFGGIGYEVEDRGVGSHFSVPVARNDSGCRNRPSGKQSV